MRTRIIMTLTAIGLLAVTLAAPLSAQRGYGRQGGGGMGPCMRPGMEPGMGPGQGVIFSELDLTAEQQSAIETIRDQYEPELQAAREASQEKREAFFAQVHDEELDEGAIRELGAELGAAEADSAIVMSSMRQEVHSVLTEEQLAQLEALKQDRGKRWSQRGNRGPRGRGRSGSEG